MVMKRYAIVVEKAKSNYAAYVPDLPGCVATGATLKATERRIREAIEILLKACAKTACPCPSLPVASITSKSRPKWYRSANVVILAPRDEF